MGRSVMNYSVIALGIFDVLDDNVAGLQCRVPKALLQQLDVTDLLVNVYSSGTHQFFGHHALVLSNEGFLAAV